MLLTTLGCDGHGYKKVNGFRCFHGNLCEMTCTVEIGIIPGGATFTICVNMCVRKFSEKGAFFGMRLRSEQI